MVSLRSAGQESCRVFVSAAASAAAVWFLLRLLPAALTGTPSPSLSHKHHSCIINNLVRPILSNKTKTVWDADKKLSLERKSSDIFIYTKRGSQQQTPHEDFSPFLQELWCLWAVSGSVPCFILLFMKLHSMIFFIHHYIQHSLHVFYWLPVSSLVS